MVIAKTDSHNPPVADAVITNIEEKPKEWLSLRDDLTLVQGPRAYDGSPTWTLYDPAVHRYFRIGWLEFECLHRWSLGNAEDIAESIRNETPIDIELSDIEHFVEFIEQNNLSKPKVENPAYNSQNYDMHQSRVSGHGCFITIYF